MVRLHVVVEGQTEETFVNQVLVPHLSEFHVYADARCLTTGRGKDRKDHAFKGGLANYEHLRRDLTFWMREDRSEEVWFTTMIDLYRLPDGFPGRAEYRSVTDPFKKVQNLECRFREDIGHRRFVPYVQVHEFEAILFCDLSALSELYPADDKGIGELVEASRKFETPEHIDEGEETAPSKRICEAVPSYAKTVAGPIVAAKIGLNAIESKCRHFREWLRTLRSLGTQPGG
jgi:hypothetical protein